MTETGTTALISLQAAERLGAVHQPAAQRAGERGQDDVVDGAAVRLADRAVVGEVGAHRDDAALLGQLAGDRASRRPGAGRPGRPRPRRRGVVAPSTPRTSEPVLVRTVSSDGAGPVERSRGPRRPDQAERRGAAVRVPAVGAERLRLLADVEQHLAEVDGLDAVDEHLVRLGEQRDPAAGQPLDDVHLPERAVAVERAGDDARHQLAQLVEGARARQRRAAHVVGEVERRVVDPDRVGQPARHHLHPLPVARARTRSARRSAGPAGRGRDPTPRGRRSRPWRCAAAWPAVSSARNTTSRGRSRWLIVSILSEGSRVRGRWCCMGF